MADARLINLPRPPLWRAHTDHQLYMTSLLTDQIGDGPTATVSAAIPDLHYFRGRGGKDVIPLYRDSVGTPNVTAGVPATLSEILDQSVTAEDLFAYAYAVLSSRAYTERFWHELETPGPRVPLTRDPRLFREAVKLGEKLINLHTFGERLRQHGRGVNPGTARIVGAIGPGMPGSVEYVSDDRTLVVGAGRVAPVGPAVWQYEVSGLRVLRSWLRYRLRDPVGRAKTSESPLDRIRPRSALARPSTLTSCRLRLSTSVSPPDPGVAASRIRRDRSGEPRSPSRVAS